MTEKSSKPCNNCVVCKKSGLKYTSLSTSLHSFPSRPEKRQIWINRCGLTDLEVIPFGKICSFHFKPTCFKSKFKRRLLHRDAVPTIFVKDSVKKTNMLIKKNKGKPKNYNKNEIPLQIYDVRDVSVKVIDFLRFPPSDILLTRSAKEMIGISKCQTYELYFKTLREINTILINACNTQKKKDKTAIMELRKQISSLKSQLKINENIIASFEANIKKL